MRLGMAVGLRVGLIFTLGWAVVSGLSAQSASGWKLVWNDDFGGASGSPPDSSKWTYDTGNNGWGNGEQENYTSSTKNAYQDGSGHLVIQVLANDAGNPYTSARIKTQGLYSFTYGKVEAKIKLPYAQGIWPAFWMLGSNISTVSWPQCGETDIMENFGVQNQDASVNHGTLHGPGYAGTGLTATYTLPAGQKFSDDFHVFSAEWSPGQVKLAVDGNVYSTITAAGAKASGGQWVFDNNPMFLILNVAVGGPTTPAPVGVPDKTTAFPQQMLVDYVRVYQAASLTATTPNIAPLGVRNAASGTDALAPGSLGSVYGVNLSDSTFSGSDLFDFSTGTFVTKTPSGVSVAIDGRSAALTYVSPTQINFQIPWESAASPSTSAAVTVSRNGTVSSPEPITLDSTSPSFFEDYLAGTALVICQSGTVAAGAACTLYGNGFGPKNQPETDGLPVSSNPPSITALEVPGGPASCAMTVGGQAVSVQYCGAAPGEVIEQLNFSFPSGTPTGTAALPAAISIGGGPTASFLLPAPAS